MLEITKLNPEQIMRYWSEIKECINSSLPPLVKDNDQSMLKIQENLLVGKLECWIGSEAGDASKIYAVATTCFVTDEISETKNLLVYTLATVNPHSQELWTKARDILSRYGKSKNCSNIIAYSNLREVENIINKLGGDSSWKILYIPIN